jgi:endonuclease/exonuclease/phosphatase family metal-dependent hydrolase
MMGGFRHFVDSRELKELYLHGRVDTWSNEPDVSTLTRIDRAFVSVDWELKHSDCLLQALSSNISDHCPPASVSYLDMQAHKRFKFNVLWTNLEGFD